MTSVDIAGYTLHLDEVVNTGLRQGVLTETAAALHSSLAASFTPLSSEIVVWRGLKTSHFEVAVGTILEEKCYFSSSRSKSVAQRFAGPRGIILQLTVSVGTPVIFLGDISLTESQEDEVLLPAGGQFQIQSIFGSILELQLLGFSSPVYTIDLEFDVKYRTLLQQIQADMQKGDIVYLWSDADSFGDDGAILPENMDYSEFEYETRYMRVEQILDLEYSEGVSGTRFYRNYYQGRLNLRRVEIPDWQQKQAEGTLEDSIAMM